MLDPQEVGASDGGGAPAERLGLGQGQQTGRTCRVPRGWFHIRVWPVGPGGYGHAPGKTEGKRVR